MNASCHRCGRPGHVRADCPDRAVRASRRVIPFPPAARATPAALERDETVAIPGAVIPFRPVLDRTATDPHPWAEQIRAARGWPSGGSDEERRVDSEFRQMVRIHPSTDKKLRILAAEQVAEFRQLLALRPDFDQVYAAEHFGLAEVDA